MKRHVILMALLCLLFVFRGVMAVPQVRDDLVYNGEMQPLAADPDQEGGFYAIGSEDYWEEIPLEDAPGEWDIYWKAAEEDAGEFIGKAKISAKELTVTWGETTLEYNWDEQAPSVTLSGCVEADADLCENPEVDGAAYDVGEYEASLYFDSEFYFIPEASRSIKYEIKPKELSVEWGETTLSYNGEEQIPQVTVTGCAGEEADLCENPIVDGSEFDAGVYEAVLSIDSSNYVLPEGTDSAEYEITPIELGVEWGETSLEYNGGEQAPQVTLSGCVEADADLCANPEVDGSEFDAGSYEASLYFDNPNYVIPEGNEATEFEITPIELAVEWSDTALEYTGDEQAPQVTLTGCVEADADLCSNPEIDGAEYDAGTYEAALYLDSVNYVLPEERAAASFEISPKELESSMIKFDEADGFIYDGEEHEISFYVEYNGNILTEGVDYIVDESSEFNGTEIGQYTVSITAVGEGTKDVVSTNFSGKASASWSILAASSAQTSAQTAAPEPAPAAQSDTPTQGDLPLADVEPAQEPAQEPVPAPADVSSPAPSQAQDQSAPADTSFNWARTGENEEDNSSLCNDCDLPNTGFSSRFSTPLSVMPASVKYTDLKMRIQIPTIGLDTELAGVPLKDGEWAVEWLGDRAGLLTGSHVPGEGLTVIAAHNTLNNSETGPFLMLYTMDHNDVIFINQPDGSLLRFGVYANMLVEPNDMQKLALIAEQEEGSLLLITCENESADGGYLNRRVVFAKPLD